MRLPKPSAPFSPVCVVGESITVDTAGKVLVLPSGNPDILPAHNEYVLSSRRLSLEDYPWGGVSDFPDFLPGTLYTATDGIYLTDIAGNNSTKTLTAGKLTELGLLTVDTDAHTITEEFIVANTAESNNPTVLNACTELTNWAGTLCTPSVSSGILGTVTEAGTAILTLTISSNLSTADFLIIAINGTAGKSGTVTLYKDASNYNVYNVSFTGSVQKYVIPIRKANTTVGSPLSAIASIKLSMLSASINDTFVISTLNSDMGKTATIEAHVPDNLSATSLSLYTHNGTAYQLCSTHSLDGAYSQLSQTSANCTFLDGTKLDDVYGTGAGRAVFPKSSAGTTVNGSTGSITYSENRGTDKRIGLTVNLPPSDNGRTNFNKIRAKLVINYTDTVGNVVPDLSGNGNTGTIIGGVTKLNSGGIVGDGATGYISTLKKISASNGLSIGIKFKTGSSLLNCSIFDSGGAYSKAKGLFVFPRSNGDLGVWISDGSTADQLTLSSVLAINTEYILQISWDGNVGTNNLKIDLNGSLTTLSSTKTWVGETTNPIKILAYTGSSSTLGYSNYTIREVILLNSEMAIGSIFSSDVPLIHYVPTVSNMGSTTHEFTDSTKASYGLQNLTTPWIAIYDPVSSEIDFYLFTHRPKNLEFKRNESGKIYEVTLCPGNGLLYHGQITYPDLTLDSDSDGVPNILKQKLNLAAANGDLLRTADGAYLNVNMTTPNGSLFQFLQSYGMIE